MLIKNRDELATNRPRKQALDIIEAGITRVLPKNIMESAVSYDPDRDIFRVNGDGYPIPPGRIFVIGGGKASGTMAETLESIIGPDKITAGIITCKEGGDYHTEKIDIIYAGHPVPDSRGITGVHSMLALRGSYSIGRDDLVICLISGGGSALMPCPAEGITLEDKREVTGLLLGSGAGIHEINTVRKHLSRTKGGQLGKYFAPATVVSLIISDVIGNDLDVIASGPTSPDNTTFSDARRVLEKHNLLSGIPERALNHIKKGIRGEVPETPKTLDNCRNYIIGDNRLALEAMAGKARQEGLTPYVITSEQSGDTIETARQRAQEIIEGKYSGYGVLLLGGETTPTLPDNPGKGGRNQHYALVSIPAMEGYTGEWVLASVGTDGSDYLPDVAGAMVDNTTSDRIKNKGLDIISYLGRYDSNTILNQTGNSLIITGNTGTNVGDVMVYILGK